MNELREITTILVAPAYNIGCNKYNKDDIFV